MPKPQFLTYFLKIKKNVNIVANYIEILEILLEIQIKKNNLKKYILYILRGL